jgi:hypothetical protein
MANEITGLHTPLFLWDQMKSGGYQVDENDTCQYTKNPCEERSSRHNNAYNILMRLNADYGHSRQPCNAGLSCSFSTRQVVVYFSYRKRLKVLIWSSESTELQSVCIVLLQDAAAPLLRQQEVDLLIIPRTWTNTSWLIPFVRRKVTLPVHQLYRISVETTISGPVHTF